MKELAFLQIEEQNLQTSWVSPTFSNGAPKDLVTPQYPVSGLQGLINQGWSIIATNISTPGCGHGAAIYRFILEREQPSTVKASL